MALASATTVSPSDGRTGLRLFVAVRRPPTTCAHCGRETHLRPRQLCFSCYFTPHIRDLYPPLVEHGKDWYSDRTSANQPCAFEPGSPEKIAEMARRYENGEPLHHPKDPKITPARIRRLLLEEG